MPAVWLQQQRWALVLPVSPLLVAMELLTEPQVARSAQQVFEQELPRRARASLEDALPEREAPLAQSVSPRLVRALVAQQAEPVVSPRASEVPAQPQEALLPLPELLAASGEPSPRRRSLSNWSASSFRLRQTLAAGQ